jgi:hypothetical protein
MKTILLALLIVAPRALAQDSAEGPGDVDARVHYERAVRAEADEEWADAEREAQAAVDAAPHGRFAEASEALLERAHQHGAVVQERPTGRGPRVELVIESTVLGLVWSSLAAGALNAGPRATAGLLMAGTGAGLGISLAASSGKRVTASVPGFLTLGAAYGGYAALLGYGLGNATPTAGGVLAASMGGAALGLLVAPQFTGGDAAAASNGVIFGSLFPLLLEASFVRDLSSGTVFGTLLAGSVAGLIAGPVVNRSVNFSRGRWNLIGLGGGVGGLFGAGVAELADIWRGDARGGFLLTSFGVAAGLGLTTWLTSSFGADEPRGTALLHLENGRLSLGNALASVAPVVHDRGHGAMLRALEGSF